MAVPATYCPRNWHSGGSYKGVPKRDLLPCAIWGGGIDTDFRKILSRSVKRDGLVILDPRSSAEISYKTPNSASGELVGSLLGGNTLNYVGHRSCVRRASAGARKDWQYVDMADLDR